MITRFITRNSIRELIPNLLTAFHVVAPVYSGNVTSFKRISSYEEIKWLDYNTDKPPKEFFLPPSDDIFQFQQHGKEIVLTEPVNHHVPRIILGVRPCDAAALTVLDRVFTEKGIDVLYTALRDNTLVIGQSCPKPGRDCFCTSVGISPDESRNMDIMLTDIGEDQFLVNLVSPKGEDFFSYFSHFFQESAEMSRSGYEPVQTQEMAVYLKKEKIFDVRVIKKWLDTHFENPFWADIAARCIGCGACTFLCPTCHCFDFTDESVVQPIDHRNGGYKGVRRRIWDSCSFGHFTQTSFSGATSRTGAEAGAGIGAGVWTGATSRTRAGTGEGDGAGVWTGATSRTRAGTGEGDGAGAGTVTRPGAGAEAWTGAQAGLRAGTGSGAGTVTRPGAGAEAWTGAQAGLRAGTGAGAGAVSGAGHQRRTTQEQRFRQRIMHKFKYFVDLFQRVACVGCGRCRSLCPVGIDLVEVLETIHDLFYQS
jgi:sulfhydrogenase subunit beta (sulfur reductase)